MPKLSMHHGAADSVSPTAARDAVHIPFVARIRLVPKRGTGKRFDAWRNLEKASTRVETQLVAANWNIATPIAFTPQFGDFEAHLTIVGFRQKSASTDGREVIAPTTDVTEIHSGTDSVDKTAEVLVNKGGSLSKGQDTVAVVDTEVGELISDLGLATTVFGVEDIVHVEYNGVKYGVKKLGGRSFPS
jgi:hypothetical protein